MPRRSTLFPFPQLQRVVAVPRCRPHSNNIQQRASVAVPVTRQNFVEAGSPSIFIKPMT